MSKLLWSPQPERVKASQLFQFIQVVNQQHGTAFSNYQDLYQWSVNHIELFWETFLSYSGMSLTTPSQITLAQSQDPTQVEWFKGSTLNYEIGRAHV